MSEPIVYSGIGFLSAILLTVVLTIAVRWLAHSGLAPFAAKRQDSAPPDMMADIEADMGQLHAQIAVATRRLEVSVAHMKSKTASQLSEIGRSSEAIARLKAEHAERTVAMDALASRERSLSEQLHVTQAELLLKLKALEDVDRKLANARRSSTTSWRSSARATSSPRPRAVMPARWKGSKPRTRRSRSSSANPTTRSPGSSMRWRG